MDVKPYDLFCWKRGDEFCQLAIWIKRADDKRTAVGEYPTVAYGGRGDGCAIAGNRRDDQQSVVIHGVVEFVWHGFP